MTGTSVLFKLLFVKIPNNRCASTGPGNVLAWSSWSTPCPNMLDADDGVSVTVFTSASCASEFVPAALIEGAQ